MHEPKLEDDRALDALIAEKVMGWTAVRRDGERIPGFRDYRGAPGGVKIDPAHPLLYWVPHYSSDIAAAWQVVEAMKDRPGEIGGDWYGASIETQTLEDGTRGYQAHLGRYHAKALTAPLAICLAAMKAVGGADGPTD